MSPGDTSSSTTHCRLERGLAGFLVVEGDDNRRYSKVAALRANGALVQIRHRSRNANSSGGRRVRGTASFSRVRSSRSAGSPS